MNAKPSELIRIDDEQDCVFIAGAKVDADVFRQLAYPTPPGRWYRTVSVGDTVTIEMRMDEQTSSPEGESPRRKP